MVREGQYSFQVIMLDPNSEVVDRASVSVQVSLPQVRKEVPLVKQAQQQLLKSRFSHLWNKETGRYQTKVRPARRWKCERWPESSKLPSLRMDVRAGCYASCARRLCDEAAMLLQVLIMIPTGLWAVQRREPIRR
jgi:hypothetical protein